MRRLLGVLTLLFSLTGISIAGTTVWAFNASFGDPHIQAYDLASGTAVADFVAPNKDAHRGRANGRGIAVAGTTIYYSLADTPNVYKTDAVTHADLGIAFTTLLSPGINSLALDGTSLWAAASQPADPSKPADDKIFQYSLTGMLLQTLTLPRPANTNLARDGFDVVPGGFVADRGSVPYDVYDSSGHLQKAFFITASFRTTGIAFDGLNYIVADAINGRLATFDAAGDYVRSVDLPRDLIAFGIVDLAVDRSLAAAPVPQFTASGVTNGASFTAGGIAPGEIISIFGSGLGPVAPAGLRLNAAGLVDTVVAGTQVLFDGLAAPIIFASNGQINLVVPYSVEGKSSVEVVTEYLGAHSAPILIPVVASAPGIFTLGQGQGAILNEDGTANSPRNPAQKGSIIAIFATGEGQTRPAGVDGKIAAAPLPAPMLPVTITLNGVDVTPLYAGSAPTLVGGVLQVNVRVPADAAAGIAPVTLRVGDALSQPGVTVALR
ncbi:MAG: hypothetical protein QOJ99_2855 [Bryobacterales bacterium]|jgi:uncharacterized protein (TIGR03437 family)|nr:hypothetical protein [Bryobacterales bacterium]